MPDSELATDGLVASLRIQPIIAILREKDSRSAIEVGERLLKAGLRQIEVSLATPNAVHAIAALADSALSFPGSRIGGGTVLQVEDVKEVSAAGGQFILSPTLDPEVLAEGRRLGLPVVPGCATPNEIIQASRLGAGLIKIFPASLWTPLILRDVLQALPSIPLCPTGGVSLVNLTEWLDAGAIAVGLGGAVKRLDDESLRTLLGLVGSRGVQASSKPASRATP